MPSNFVLSPFAKAPSEGFTCNVDIVTPLIIGLIISSLLAMFIPSNYFELYGSGIVGMIIMLFFMCLNLFEVNLANILPFFIFNNTIKLNL